MGLETGTRIQDLVPTNPVGATDFASQGDDHIRLIKACIQGSFPSLGADAVNATAAQLNNLASLVALSIIGRAANSTGAPAAITAAANDRILRRVADALDFGQLTAGMFPNTVVPDAALSSNVPLKNAANTFSANQTIQVGSDAYVRVSTGSNYAYLGNNGSTAYLYTSGAIGWTIYVDGVEAGSISAARNWAIAAPASGNTLTLNNASANVNTEMTDGTVRAFFQPYATGNTFAWGTLNDYSISFYVNSTVRMKLYTGLQLGAPTGGDKGAGTVNAAGDIHVNGEPLGYKRLYLRAFSGDANTAASDEGRGVRYVGAGGHTFTLDSDMPTDAVVMLINEGGGAITIAASTELRWFSGAGGGYATGSRTFADGGVAFAQHAGSGVYRVWGNGLS